jgi:hypothetical protein
MTPNFDEGIDKTHSIGVPDFVGEPAVRTNEPVLGELELSRAIRFGLFELLAEFDVPFNVKWTPEQEDAINRAEDELIALVRAYDARQLRELPKDIISEADGCGYEQCSYCYPELVLDENGKVIKIEDVEKLADELEGK